MYNIIYIRIKPITRVYFKNHSTRRCNFIFSHIDWVKSILCSKYIGRTPTETGPFFYFYFCPNSSYFIYIYVCIRYKYYIGIFIYIYIYIFIGQFSRLTPRGFWSEILRAAGGAERGYKNNPWPDGKTDINLYYVYI